MYTELFDYSYDGLNEHNRIQSFNQEIIRLCRTPLRTLKTIYLENAQEIDAKILHNKQLANRLQANQWGSDFDTDKHLYIAPPNLKNSPNYGQ